MNTQTDQTFCVVKGAVSYKPTVFVLSARLERKIIGAQRHRLIASGLTLTEARALVALLNAGEQHES